MRTYYIIITLSLLFAVSCGDVINSDDNYLKEITEKKQHKHRLKFKFMPNSYEIFDGDTLPEIEIDTKLGINLKIIPTYIGDDDSIELKSLSFSNSTDFFVNYSIMNSPLILYKNQENDKFFILIDYTFKDRNLEFPIQYSKVKINNDPTLCFWIKIRYI